MTWEIFCKMLWPCFLTTMFLWCFFRAQSCMRDGQELEAIYELIMACLFFACMQIDRMEK